MQDKDTKDRFAYVHQLEHRPAGYLSCWRAIDWPLSGSWRRASCAVARASTSTPESAGFAKHIAAGAVQMIE